MRRMLSVTLLLVLFATPAFAAFEVESALPNDAEAGTRVEAVLMIKDFRHLAERREEFRRRLMKTTLGASFLSPEAMRKRFGFDILSEAAALSGLLRPDGGPVPAALVLFTMEGELRPQIILRADKGLLERIDGAFGSEKPPAWPGRVEEGFLRVGKGEKTLLGRLGEDGWLRLAPQEQMLVAGASTVPLLEGAAARWTEDADIVFLFNGGGFLTTELSSEATSPGAAAFLSTLQRVIVAVGRADDGTATMSLLLDSPLLMQFAPMIRPPVINRSVDEVWGEEASAFLTVNLPPVLIAGTIPSMLTEMQAKGVAPPPAVTEAIMNFDGRISAAYYGTPGDWAFGLQFRDEETAAVLVPSLREWINTLAGEKGAGFIAGLNLEKGEGAGESQLRFGENSGLDGLSVSAAGPTVILARQSSRAAALLATRGDKGGKGALTAGMAAVLERPAMLTSYRVLADDNSIYGDLGLMGLMFRESLREAAEKEIGARFILPVAEYLPTMLRLVRAAMNLTYDMALWADMDGGTLVIQVLTSELEAGGPYLDAINERMAGNVKGYYDGLFALAHEEPETRAGRRARSTLTSSPLNAIAVGGIIAAIAVPNFINYRTRAARSRAKADLNSLRSHQVAYFAEYGAYCRSFEECGYEARPDGKYFLFIGPGENDVTGGFAVDNREAALAAALQELAAAGVEPGVGAEDFLLAAVGDPDGDGAFEIWIMDSTGEAVLAGE